MSNSTTDVIRELLVKAHCPDPIIEAAAKAEVVDARWSDVGRMVYPRIVGDDFIKAINRAGMKCNGSTLKLTAMVRAYILTGTLP